MGSQKLNKREFLKLLTCSTCGVAMMNPLSKLVAKEAEKYVNLLANPQSGELWKWSKEAFHYIQTPKGLKCKICPHNCEIEEGKMGDCRTRIAIGSKLYTIAYGNPCAVHIDPIEKKPLYHYLPGSRSFSIATAGCNLACLNCQNWEISQVSAYETRNYDLMPDKVVAGAIENKCASIAYTYSDPVAFYEYTYDTAKLARLKGIKNLMISAGYINPDPLKLLCQYIDAANIDLKSFENETYEMLNGGTLQPVLDCLKIMKEMGVWLEITNLVIPTWTDSMDMIKKMCDWLYDNGFQDTPLHFSRFEPLYKLTHLPQTPVTVLEKAREIALAAGIKYVYIGNVPNHPAENTYCPKCKKIVVERKGFAILQNNIVNNCCKFCGERIAGVWG